MKSDTTHNHGPCGRSLAVAWGFLRMMALVTALAVSAHGAWAADLPPWIEHTFDVGNGFRTGSLCGQGNWTKWNTCPKVVRQKGSQGNKVSDWGQVVLINPAAGRTIGVRRTITVPGERWQLLEFDVHVTPDTVDASLAKIVVNTNEDSWGRKFQFYVGSSMRVNYGPTGDQSLMVVPADEMILDRWYHVRCLMDVSASLLDVWVGPYGIDGTDRHLPRLAHKAFGIPIHPGKITGLDLWGWDRPGAVRVDNLVGYAQRARITSPDREAGVEESVTVSVAGSPSVETVDLFADGVLLDTLQGNGGSFLWDSAANPLPAPSTSGFGGAPFGFGYHFTRIFGGVNHWSEVSGYTNLYHAWAGQQYGGTDTDRDVWLDKMQQDLYDVCQEDKRIVLQLNLTKQGKVTSMTQTTTYADVLSIFTTRPGPRPDWGKVVAVEICNDCNGWTAAQFNNVAQKVKTAITPLGMRPLGAVLAPFTSAPAVVSAAQLDFVAYEAYLRGTDGPKGSYEFSPLSHKNVAAVRAKVENAIHTISAKGKAVVIIMQAYTRNDYWPNADLVRDLQVPTYLETVEEAAEHGVHGIEVFSYDRSSGTLDHPHFAVPHRLIGEAVMGSGAAGPQPVGIGRRTLSIRACNASGSCTWDSVIVDVSSCGDGICSGTENCHNCRDCPPDSCYTVACDALPAGYCDNRCGCSCELPYPPGGSQSICGSCP